MNHWVPLRRPTRVFGRLEDGFDHWDRLFRTNAVSAYSCSSSARLLVTGAPRQYARA